MFSLHLANIEYFYLSKENWHSNFNLCNCNHNQRKITCIYICVCVCVCVCIIYAHSCVCVHAQFLFRIKLQEETFMECRSFKVWQRAIHCDYFWKCVYKIISWSSNKVFTFQLVLSVALILLLDPVSRKFRIYCNIILTE